MSKKYDCIVTDKITKKIKWAYMAGVFLVNRIYINEFKNTYSNLEINYSYE